MAESIRLSVAANRRRRRRKHAGEPRRRRARRRRPILIVRLGRGQLPHSHQAHRLGAGLHQVEACDVKVVSTVASRTRVTVDRFVRSTVSSARVPTTATTNRPSVASPRWRSMRPSPPSGRQHTHYPFLCLGWVADGFSRLSHTAASADAATSASVATTVSAAATSRPGKTPKRRRGLHPSRHPRAGLVEVLGTQVVVAISSTDPTFPFATFMSGLSRGRRFVFVLRSGASCCACDGVDGHSR